MSADPPYTAQDVDRAVQSLGADPDRFAAATEIVKHATPGLQRVLGEALAQGGWFEEDYAEQLRGALKQDDPRERERMVRTLIAEETRLGMLVGVAVGLELADELENGAL